MIAKELKRKSIIATHSQARVKAAGVEYSENSRSNRVVAPLVGEAWKAEPYKGGYPLGYGFGYFFHKK